MEKLHKNTRLLFFSGLVYSLMITLLALVLYLVGGGLFPYAAKELVFVASEILSFSIIFSAFVEIFIRRFKG